MDTTSVNLLRRLKCADAALAWQRFTQLYVPLIYLWSRQHGLNQTDASDLVQDVLATLVVKLPSFEYDPQQRFRGWLHKITLNRARDWHRRNQHRQRFDSSTFVETLCSPEQADLFSEHEYRSFLVDRARRLIATEFESVTWQACWKYVTEDRTAEEVGHELGISANAVRVAKCRVLRRLREELGGMLD